MNTQITRDFMAHAMIALAVCLGAWMMLVRPKIDEVSRLEREVAEGVTNAAPLSQQSIEAMVKRIPPIRDRVKQVIAYDRLADDSSRLYGAVMDLADVHHVQVQSLQPGSAPQASPDGQVTTKHIDLTVVGSHQNVAGFLDSMNTLDGFARPSSLQVLPVRVGNQPLVSATFGFDVLSFKLNDELVVLQGETNAQH